MNIGNKLIENDLAAPVVSLFPALQYSCFEQVPLARKKIDLVFVQREVPLATSVELKIANWKRALWQATVNFQIVQESYIAIWHKYVHRVEKRLHILQDYGVGLIVVEHDVARIVLRSKEPPRRIPLSLKEKWYRGLVTHAKSA